jgi:chorismate mutase
MMMNHGVRGAITADANTQQAIVEAAAELLQEMVKRNDIAEHQVASVLFTTTPDLNAAYPAGAAREIGWNTVAVLGFQEIDVDGGLARCIRILILWNTLRRQSEIQHVFLKDAASLRPDLVKVER